MALHTAGDLLNFHPHVHSMMLHGATDRAGTFHALESIDTEYLTKRFQHRLLEALRNEQARHDEERCDRIVAQVPVVHQERQPRRFGDAGQRVTVRNDDDRRGHEPRHAEIVGVAPQWRCEQRR